MSKRMIIKVLDSEGEPFECSFALPGGLVAAVKILSDGGRKIACIKAIRTATGCDLREGKSLIENLPQTINASPQAASTLADMIRDAGGDAYTGDAYTINTFSRPESFEARLYALIGEEYLG